MIQRYSSFGLTFLFLQVGILSAFAQIHDFQYEATKVLDPLHVVLSLELSPDGQEIAASTYHGEVLILDADTYERKRTLDVRGFQAGSLIKYSPDGRYIMVRKHRPQDWNLNKDHRQHVIVLDAISGAEIASHDDIYDLDISPDGVHFAIMDKAKLSILTLADGHVVHEMHDERFGSSIAFGPEGEMLYASRGFDKKDLKKDPRFKKDRKGRKAYSKFQQTIIGIDVDNGQASFISEENMDEIYDMRCSERQDRLLVYAKQDEKVNTRLNTNFILQMDLSTGILLREQFNSRVADPCYREDVTTSRIAVSTSEDLDASQSVLIYDQMTNDIVARFDVDARFLEGLFQGKLSSGSATFDFSQDGTHLIAAIGNMMYTWEITEQD